MTVTKTRIRWITAGVLLATGVALATSAVLMRHGDKTGVGTDRPAWQMPLLDVDGQVHIPFEDDQCRAIAFVFMKTQCPISNRIIPDLKRLAREFSSHGIRLFSVNSDVEITGREVAAHRDKFTIEIPVLLTSASQLRRELNPTHSPQAVVISLHGDVLYSGAIDDRHIAPAKASRPAAAFWLRDAFKAIAMHQPVAVPRTDPVGCVLEPLESTSADTQITYAQHIAPILQVHCVGCHHAGDVAPFPLTTFAEVKRHAEQIDAVISNGSMPPWKPVGQHSQFRDDLRLTSTQIQRIQTWVKQGKPFGDEADLPAPRKFPSGWRLGAPDVVLEMPETFTVPADGDDIYRYFVLPLELDSPRLIAAVEFQPGNPQVVHHAGFWFDRTGMAREHDRKQPGPGYTSFGGPGIPGWIGLGNWTPGTTPQRLPAGSGRRVPVGSDLVLQIHYHPTGRVEWDRSRVGLYFAEPTARRQVAEIAIGDMTLDIPPNAEHHEHKAEYTLPVDTFLLDVYPHMHLLGRQIKATAHLPSGKQQELIRIEDWDYAWQPRYSYLRPQRLPAGTRIELLCIYDNSTDNPYQPSSNPQRVFWGEGATDEMGLIYFQVLPVQDADFERLASDNSAYYDRTLADFWRLFRQRTNGG